MFSSVSRASHAASVSTFGPNYSMFGSESKEGEVVAIGIVVEPRVTQQRPSHASVGDFGRECFTPDD